MAHIVKVEFAIHDAKKDENSSSKVKNGRYGSRPKSASLIGKQTQSTPYLASFTPLQEISTSPNNKSNNNLAPSSVKFVDIGKNATVNKSSPDKTHSEFPVFVSNNTNFPSFRPSTSGATTGGVFDTHHHMSSSASRDLRLSPEERTKQQLQNTRTIHATHQRFNPAKRVPPIEDGFKFSAKPPDRDELLRDQDRKILAYRQRHPEIYEPPTDFPKSPHLEREACRHDVNERITPRDRTTAKSNRAHAQDPLPFYPFLRENENHGIHKERWNVMTVPSDEPERFRPHTTGTATKSHEDFDKWFHNDKWQKQASAMTGRGQHTMTIERADLL